MGRVRLSRFPFSHFRFPFCVLPRFALQTGVGFVNVLLAAPGWLQIVHLAMAQAVWISTWLVWLAARRR